LAAGLGAGLGIGGFMLCLAGVLVLIAYRRHSRKQETELSLDDIGAEKGFLDPQGSPRRSNSKPSMVHGAHTSSDLSGSSGGNFSALNNANGSNNSNISIGSSSEESSFGKSSMFASMDVFFSFL
jgi:hypothetical protein